MYSLVILEKARLEWLDAFEFYEFKKRGLGKRFSVNHINKNSAPSCLVHPAFISLTPPSTPLRRTLNPSQYPV
jgi:hypothetical protein